MTLAAIQALDKMAFCMKAIESLSAENNPNLIGTINVIASEILKELVPEIEAIKSDAMKADAATADKYKPGDVIGGY